MATTHQFKSTLKGFISVFEDGGQFNNRCFSYSVPDDIIEKLADERPQLLDWARNKAKGKVLEDFAPWEKYEPNTCKYSYSSESKNPEPVFVDAQGTPLADKNILKDVRGGTVVEIIIEHKPSMPVGKIGSKLIVKGVQILKLVTSSGASDSGDLSSEEIAASFKKQEGFCQDDPNVQMDQKEATDEYNF